MPRLSFAHTSTGRATLLWVLAGVLALAALQRLTDGFLQLVWASTEPIDLAIRWREVQHPWVRLGVAALVARFLTFHHRYDDLLVLVPVVALIRIVNREPLDRAAAVMLALLTATLLIPARLLFPPAPWQAIEAVQTVVWLAALGYLVSRVRRDQRSGT